MRVGGGLPGGLVPSEAKRGAHEAGHLQPPALRHGRHGARVAVHDVSVGGLQPVRVHHAGDYEHLQLLRFILRMDNANCILVLSHSHATNMNSVRARRQKFLSFEVYSPLRIV